jgi:hypothetical protein
MNSRRPLASQNYPAAASTCDEVRQPCSCGLAVMVSQAQALSWNDFMRR